jgi:hypothetical protein
MMVHAAVDVMSGNSGIVPPWLRDPVMPLPGPDDDYPRIQPFPFPIAPLEPPVPPCEPAAWPLP